jgi:hypothetical protein
VHRDRRGKGNDRVMRHASQVTGFDVAEVALAQEKMSRRSSTNRWRRKRSNTPDFLARDIMLRAAAAPNGSAPVGDLTPVASCTGCASIVRSTCLIRLSMCPNPGARRCSRCGGLRTRHPAGNPSRARRPHGCAGAREPVKVADAALAPTSPGTTAKGPAHQPSSPGWPG